jgi:hypothetical protein
MSGIVPSFILKASRAKEHFQEVQSLVTSYAERHPYTMLKGPEEDGKCFHYLKFSEQPSDEIAIAAGDVIHNVRSGLNHLATALVPSQYRKKVQFPIFITDPFDVDPGTQRSFGNRSRDRASWNRSTDGMPDGAIAFLKSVQPYALMWQRDQSVDGLTIIEELSNNDKHRQLILLATGLKDGTIKYTWPDGNKVTRTRFGDLKDGARDTLPMPVEVDVEIQGTTAIAVDLGEDAARPGHHVLLELVGSLEKAINVLEGLALTGLTPYLLPTE